MNMKMPKFLAKLLVVVLVATNIQTVKSSAQQVDNKSTIKREESVEGSKNTRKIQTKTRKKLMM